MYDVVVLGGGPAGVATAIASARRGLSVALVEASRAETFRIGETIPPEVEGLLGRLGVWESFVHDEHLRVAGACSAWGEEELVWQDGFTSPYGEGWRLDRARFDATLLREAERAGVSVLKRTRLAAVDRVSGGWLLQLRPAPTLAAAFLVDATGRAASVARQFGAARVRADCTVALFCVFDLVRSAPPVLQTLVEAVEHGWWYAARVPYNKVLVSLFTDVDLVRRYDFSRAEVWGRLLCETRYAWPFAEEPPAPARVTITSAASHCLDHVAGDGWIAVGDAATAWDPLASAGIYLALRSGLEAAEAITRTLDGNVSALRVYARETQFRFTHFLIERRAYYALESRWPASLFWRRRTGIPP